MPSGASARAQGDVNRRWPATPTGKSPWLLAEALGYPMQLRPPRPRSWTRSRADAHLRRRLLRARLDALGSHPVALQRRKAPEGTPIMHIDRLRARQGQASCHRIRADRRAHRPALPAAPDHRPHAQPVQCRRPDASHANSVWHEEDRARDPSARCEDRGIRDGDWVALHEPRRRDECCGRMITERVQPGVVYTTFHYPGSGRPTL